MEDRLGKLDGDTLNVRQTNAVVKEIREIEKRGKNLIFGNIPESTQTETEERKKYDERKVEGALKELKIEGVKPTKVIRVGKEGRYPRKVLAIFRSVDECEQILKSAAGVKLSNDVFLTRDRTYNQRQEARLYRMEKEREEHEGATAQRGRSRGNGRGPGRPRGNGSVRGRGARGARDSGPQSKKRQRSGSEEGSKRRRTSTQGGDGEGLASSAHQHSPEHNADVMPRGRPATPVPAQLPLIAGEGEHDF